MNYERMWFELKNRIVRESSRRELGTSHVKEQGEQKYQDMKELREQCKKKGAEILAKIFGNDYVDNLDDLEKKLMQKDRKMVMVAGGMEIPENLMNLARERKISIVHANCEAVEIGRPFPFPFPPGFMK